MAAFRLLLSVSGASCFVEASAATGVASVLAVWSVWLMVLGILLVLGLVRSGFLGFLQIGLAHWVVVVLLLLNMLHMYFLFDFFFILIFIFSAIVLLSIFIFILIVRFIPVGLVIVDNFLLLMLNLLFNRRRMHMLNGLWLNRVRLVFDMLVVVMSVRVLLSVVVLVRDGLRLDGCREVSGRGVGLEEWTNANHVVQEDIVSKSAVRNDLLNDLLHISKGEFD